MRTVVTRNGQITIPKEARERLGIREGTPLQVNISGNRIIIAKSTPDFWKNFKGGFLPKDFEEMRKTWRTDEIERLKKLGIFK